MAPSFPYILTLLRLIYLSNSVWTLWIENFLVADNDPNVLDSCRDNWTLLIVRKHGDTFIERAPASVRFTKSELQKLHLHFFHPNFQKLYNVRKEAIPNEFDVGTKSTLEEIAKACRNCQQHRSKPYRFRVSIQSDEAQFNHEVSVDLKWLQSHPLLYILGTQTLF